CSLYLLSLHDALPISFPSAETQSRDLEAAAHTLGLQLHVIHAVAERDLDTVFATLVRLRPGGLVICPDPFFSTRIEQLATLTLRSEEHTSELQSLTNI